MPITALILAGCAILGALLAQSWLPIRAGFLGGGLMLITAYWLRGHWQRDRSAPETVERAALLSIAGTLICLGYLSAKLYQLGPELDIHARATRLMAGELWMLVAAAFLLQWVARTPDDIRDERDREIASRSLALSCYALLAMQTVLVVWISLAIDRMRPAPTMAMLAHLFICSWMAAHIFYGICCMVAYASTRSVAHGAS